MRLADTRLPFSTDHKCSRRQPRRAASAQMPLRHVWRGRLRQDFALCNITRVCYTPHSRSQNFLSAPLLGRFLLVPRRKIKSDPHVESAIGRRVQQIRESLRYGQAEFASLVGLTRDQLANVESGRTPLRYSVAWRMHEKWDEVSLSKVAGLPHYLGHADWPSVVDPAAGIGPQSLLSEVAGALALSDKRGSPQTTEVEGQRRYSPPQFPEGSLRWWMEETVEETIGKLLEGLPDGVLAEFWGQYVKYARFAGIELDSFEWRFPEVLIRSKAALSANRNASADGGQQTSLLTRHSQESKTTGVQPIISELVGRIRKATQARGSKTKLAKWLGTSPQSVTDWLAGRKEPSGETTLRLLAWVTAEEAKQQESPAGVPPPAEQKTRKEQHEKSSIKPSRAET